jgi:glutamyl-tRNA synthetase
MPEGETVWADVVGGETRFRNSDIEDFILLRSDGTPTYNMAVVSDDVAMGMTHVIRGADHISNTPKQIQIYRALSAQLPVFCHVPLILGSDGKRLSKRHGATAVGQYRADGILPEAVDNFLALLGWSPGEDRELMSVEEIVDLFTLERINKKSAVFDHEKLEWLNGQHIAAKSAASLLEWVAPRLIDEGTVDATDFAARREWYERTVDSVKTRARTFPELLQRVRFYFLDAVEYDPEAVAKHWKDSQDALEKLGRLMAVTREVDDWSEESLEAQVRALAEDMGIGAGKLIHPLRLALTGTSVSPGIFEVMNLMGRERVISRIDDALNELNTSID